MFYDNLASLPLKPCQLQRNQLVPGCIHQNQIEILLTMIYM